MTAGDKSSRRRFLKLGLTGPILGISGCTGLLDEDSQATTTSSTTTETDGPPGAIGEAKFAFEFKEQKRRVVIRFTGGTRLKGRNLQVQSTSGKQVNWAELGSTVTGTDERLNKGTTAELGANILNWGQPVGRSETIRLVYTGKDTPTTLGRFTPPERTTLTTTVPTTESPTTTETPPETSGTPATTETQTPDTTAPSISSFSIANPSDQMLRTSFDSNEQLSTILVSITGPESVTLTRSDFAETNTSKDRYTYEATYEISSEGSYTATLSEATDGSGNDGADEQSVTLSLASQSNILFSDDFDDGIYDDTWNVTREHDVESVTEENGIFTYSSPISETIYEPDMTVITDQTISGTGTHILKAEFRIESYRRIRPFRLLDENSEDIISLNEEEHNGSFVLSLPDNKIDLDSDLGDGSWRTYQIKIDFDSNQIISVTRGDETYPVNESFSPIFEEYKLGIGEGNGKSQFKSISVQQTPKSDASKTLADFENGWDNFDIMINESIEGHPQQGTDANAERTTTDAYSGDYSIRVQCSMNGNNGDVVARQGNIDVGAYSTLTAWSKLLIGNTYGSPRIRVYDSTDTQIGNLDIRNQEQGEWKKTSFDISDEDSITIHLEASSGAGAEQEALIDYLQLLD